MKLNEKNKNVYCPVPFHEQMIDSDGSIRLCCSARNAILNDDGTETNITKSTLEEVWNNKHMQEIRQNMIDGVKPTNSMCENCYKDEQVTGTSSRIHELETYIKTYKEYNSSIIVDTLPDYYDLRLGNLCNMQCIMCDAHYSSKHQTENTKILNILEEHKQSDISGFPLKKLHEWYYGIEKQTERVSKLSYNWPLDDKIFNGVIERMEKSQCHKLYINGGEPTIVDSISKLLQALLDSGQAQHMELWLNTNASVVNLEFYSLVAQFKKVRIMLSIDGINESFNYIRYPGNWNQIDKNIHTIVDFINNTPDTKKWSIDFHPTLQLLNLLDIEDMLTYWLDIGEKYMLRRGLSCNYNLENFCIDPEWYALHLANPKVRKELNDQLQTKFKLLHHHTNVLDKSLMYNDPNLSEENRHELLDTAIYLHEVYKQTRKLDKLDDWFYNTIDRLR